MPETIRSSTCFTVTGSDGHEGATGVLCSLGTVRAEGFCETNQTRCTKKLAVLMVRHQIHEASLAFLRFMFRKTSPRLCMGVVWQ